MRFLLLSLVLTGCARGPTAEDPQAADPIPASLCTVSPEQSQCAVRLETAEGSEVTALQLDLSWDPQGATLTAVNVPDDVIVHTSPPVAEATGQIRVVLVRPGPPSRIAGPDGVAFTAEFDATRQATVTVAQPVATDASATKLPVTLLPGRLQTGARP
jgi:hypothetical protein